MKTSQPVLQGTLRQHSGQGREVAAMKLIRVGNQTPVLDEQIQERPRAFRDGGENLGTG